MLVLSRKAGEGIKIGGTIIVTVLETSGDRVRLGIDAPKELTVLRLELLEAVKEANQEAAGVTRDLARDLAALVTLNQPPASEPEHK